MATFKIPYLKLRDGRPRWEPGPGLRAKGFSGRDLKDEAGKWLDEGAAMAAARALNDDVERWRRDGGRMAPPAPQKTTRTFAALADLWLGSPRFGKLAASSQADYRRKLALFLTTFDEVPVAVVAKSDVYGWWEECYREHGHAMANGTVAVVRSMLTYATMKGWRADNPAMKLQLETLPPRVVIWSPAECAALVAAADRMKLYAVGDAAVIALHTAQRLSDVLELEYKRTEKGYAEFRQNKTGARVRVPLTDQLRNRLDAIKKRRTSGPMVDIERIGRIVLRDDTGGSHDGSSFNKAFRQVRAAIAADHPDAQAKWFLDFRDTAITRLALAGATLPEIRAITGHKLETIAAVLQHYLALDDRMADAGIDKLKLWMEREGIAV